MIHRRNSMEAGFQFYVRVVEQAIEERGRTENGNICQVANIDKMRDMIRKAPKDAQMAIQMLYDLLKDPNAMKSGNPPLHGTWLMIAYLLEYGYDDPSTKMLRKMVPEFYEAAILEARREGLQL